MCLNCLANYFAIFFVLNFTFNSKGLRTYFDENFESLREWLENLLVKDIEKYVTWLQILSKRNVVDVDRVENAKNILQENSMQNTITSIEVLKSKIEDILSSFKDYFIKSFQIIGMYSLLIIIVSGFEDRFRSISNVYSTAFAIIGIIMLITVLVKFLNALFFKINFKINSIFLFSLSIIPFFIILCYGFKFTDINEQTHLIKLFTVFIVASAFIFYYFGVINIIISNLIRFWLIRNKDRKYRKKLSLKMNTDYNKIFKT